MKHKFCHKRILPQKKYHKIIVDAYLHEHFLLRYALQNKPIKKGDTNYASHFKASQFWDGLSVNLLSIYKKQDAAFIILGDKDSPQHSQWNEGDEPYPVDSSILRFKRNRGVAGIKIKHLLNVKIDKKDIKVGGVTIRQDTVKFTLEHAPTFTTRRSLTPQARP